MGRQAEAEPRNQGIIGSDKGKVKRVIMSIVGEFFPRLTLARRSGVSRGVLSPSSSSKKEKG